MSAPSKTIQIIRYANRKMYRRDSYGISHGYLSYADIENLIKSGERVQIVSHDDGSDLTVKILASLLAKKYRATLGRVHNTRLMDEIRASAG